MKILFAALLICLSTLAAPAEAGAYAAYQRGDYARAVEIATASGRAEDLALAARSLNAVAYFDHGRKSERRAADDAFEFADQAIALDPALPEAHLQAAIAIALKAARMSPVKAFFSGFAGKARKKIDRALALDKQNPWALSASAAWRIEVARRGGAALYGADPEEGFEEFMAARALAPENITIAHECALRLLADGRPAWRAPALLSLDAALKAAPTTKFEADIQARSLVFRAAIDKGLAAERAFIAAQP